ncbi:MAG: SDR family NAD(P)-dependent oxidoreductase [Desulfomonile sp.]|nr:SDR family NAD(P)-dependent oxidoreductase [Desulfomonile sp.]
MGRYSFDGKNVLVTGASGGLGSTLVRKLADLGARLVVTSRSAKALDELISGLPTAADITPIIADLSVPGDAKTLAESALDAVGHIDVLFNNAGLGYFALMEETTEERIRYLFEVNTFSPLALIRALVPHMKSRGGGRIVNIVSAAGRVPIPSVGVYGGSKSALAVMTNTMRLELAPFGIDIINVYPGTIDSSFEENALRESNRSGLCPTDRCGEPKFRIADQVLEAAAGKPGEVWLERQGKRLAVAALIWPAFVERRLKALRDKVVKTTSLKQRRWRLMQVESAIACNLRCVMCPWTEIRSRVEHRGLMTQEIWNAIKPHLPEVTTVDFTGGGEPLLQPRLAEWIADAKAAGCQTGILTNGLLLTREVAAKLIAAGLDWICVSMDGATKEVYEKIRQGSDFERVCDNLAAVAELRRGRVPMTMINFVLMPMNFHQVEEIVTLAAKLGVDQVNFKQCEVVRGEHGKGFGLFASEESKETRRREKNVARACSLAKKLGVATTAFSFTPTELPVCGQDPRDSVFIRYDGTAGPCINLAVGGTTRFFGEEVTMPQVHYGRVTETELTELWETEPCRRYRERFQERVQAYEKVYRGSLITGSLPSADRLKASAIAAMPEALEGCRVCHYLYDI